MDQTSLAGRGRRHSLKSYIEKKALPKMGLAGRQFTLEPTRLGNRNVIFFLLIQGCRDIVLKGFKKETRVRNHLIANRFLERCSMDVPRTLFSDLSRKTYRAFGYYFICEEKVTGRNLAETGDLAGCIPAVAAFYARLHAIHSSRWGKLRSGHKYGFHSYILSQITTRLNALASSRSRAGLLDLVTYLKWFERKQETARVIGNFSLCHGDVNKKNIFITERGRVCIIDNEAIKYMPFPAEFYRLQFTLCEDDAYLQRLFDASYLDCCSIRKQEQLGICGDFYRAYVLLECACYYSRKAGEKKIDNGLRAWFESNCAKSVNALNELL